MATEFNYVVNVDTTRVMGAMSEVRSQIGMALGGATGFSGVGGLTGGGSDFSGGASAAFGKMMGGMGGGFKFGTFTNDAMSYMPHYGMVQAHTTLEQERAINQGGSSAAQQFKPPGVSSTEFALGVQGNFIDRNISAKYEAGVAARSSFYAGVGGLAGGEVASRLVGAPLGAMAGGKIASKLFGAGAAATGKMIGGFGGMLAAYSVADDVIGGAIRGHYAERQMTEGISRELGEIAGAGRNLGRTQRYDLGSAAMGAAKNLNMDVQEMGDILALGRQSGMLPSSTDPGKAKQQFQDFARAVEEGAQVLHTSLAGATQVIKSATSSGMGAEEGVMRAAGMGGAGAFLRNQAFMNAGAQTGLSMGYTAGQGSGMFGGALGQASGAGLSGTEMRIGGGRMAVAREIASTQMAMAKGPMGDMQLMAAMSGEALGGAMDLPGQAMGAMGQGGDFMSNAVNFMVHKDEYRRGIGSKGIRAMARQQISSMGEIIQELAPGVDQSTANRMAGISMGMTPDQAERVVGGTMARAGGGGGGYGGAMAKSRQMEAMQGMMLSRISGGISPPSGDLGGSGSGVTLGGTAMDMATFAATGAMIGGGWGAAAGAAAGLGYNAIKGGAALFGGPSSAREAAQEYDQAMAKAKRKAGYVDLDPGYSVAFQTADLSQARLDIASSSNPELGARLGAQMSTLGYQEVAAGPGSFHVGGGKYYSNADAQDAMRKARAWDKPVSAKDGDSASLLAYSAMYTGGRKKANDMQNASDSVRLAAARLEAGEGTISKELRKKYSIGDDWDIGLGAAPSLFREGADAILAGTVGSKTTGKFRESILRTAGDVGGIKDSRVLAVLSAATGADITLPSTMMDVGRPGSVATRGAVGSADAQRRDYLASNLDISITGSSGAIRDADHASRSLAHEKAAKAIQSRIMNGNFSKLSKEEEEALKPVEHRTIQEVDVDLKKELVEKMVATPQWKKGRYDEAAQIAQMSMGKRGKGLSVGHIDGDAKVRKKDALIEAGSQMFWSGIAGHFGFDEASDRMRDNAKKAMEKHSIKELEEHMNGTVDIRKVEKKVNRPKRGASNTVGWGQQEESMSLINKSLKRTHKMIEVLDKKVSGMGSQPNGSATTSGGKQ